MLSTPIRPEAYGLSRSRIRCLYYLLTHLWVFALLHFASCFISYLIYAHDYAYMILYQRMFM